MNIHTNEKPYVCDICGERFKQGSLLCVHKKTHKLRKKNENFISIPKLTDLLTINEPVEKTLVLESDIPSLKPSDETHILPPLLAKEEKPELSNLPEFSPIII